MEETSAELEQQLEQIDHEQLNSSDTQEQCAPLISGLSERWQRRLLRNSLHNRDMCKLKGLIHKGINVNMVISEVFMDTPLIYAVKCGYLELVEVLTGCPGCQVDQTDRNKHSPLDEAIRAWLTSSTSEGKHVHARRYRVLRCLFTAGASRLTPSLLDNLVFSVLNTQAGQQQVSKMVKLTCQLAKDSVRSIVLSVLALHKNTISQLSLLLSQGTSPLEYALKESSRHCMQLENAIILVKACNHKHLLVKVERDTSHYQSVEGCWARYKHLLRLLVLSGHSLRLTTMNFLFLNHADMYRWASGFVCGPPTLAQLSRVEIRNALAPNVITGTSKLKDIPKDIRLYLLFEKL